MKCWLRAEKILADIAAGYDAESRVLRSIAVESMMEAWSELFVNIVNDKVKKD